jgi:hypothetical protein
MAEAIFSNVGVLSVENSTGTEVPIAGIRDVEIIPGYETTELYTIDSTFRDAVKQYEHSVEVNITYANFDIEAAQQWLGGEGTTATASTDTEDPTLFTVQFVSESADGTFERTAAATKVVFPQFPLVQATQDEFEEFDLSGSGRIVETLTDTSGA